MRAKTFECTAGILAIVCGLMLMSWSQPVHGQESQQSNSSNSVTPPDNRITPDLDSDPMMEDVELPDRPTPDQRESDTGQRVIRSGDRIQIEVGGENWGGKYQVPRNGKINFRFIGTVDVSGKTKAELTQLLENRLRDYYRRPDVIVNFVEIRARKGPSPIYFGGHVSSKGSINPDGPLTFARAIALVGGFSEKATPEKTRILRRNDRLQVINGFKQQDPSSWDDVEPVTLNPGDYVYVPGGRFKTESSQIYSAGAVSNPSIGTIKNPVPFGVAITKTSQGLTGQAKLENVRITRANGDTVTINGQKQLELAKLSPEERFYVKPGDYIYVPSEGIRTVEITILGAVGQPQKLEMSGGEGVMDALVKAGSIQKNSDRWKMYIFRKDGDETIVKHASYSRYVQGDLDQNIPLKDGDVVYVRTRFWPYFDTLNDVLQSLGLATGQARSIDNLRDLGE